MMRKGTEFLFGKGFFGSKIIDDWVNYNGASILGVIRFLKKLLHKLQFKWSTELICSGQLLNQAKRFPRETNRKMTTL